MKQYEYAKKLTQSRLNFTPPIHPGILIRDKRTYLNLTLTEVAIGICNPSTLSKIESGNYCPNSTILHSLYERLNLETDSKFDSSDYLSLVRLRLYQHDLTSLKQLKTSLHYQSVFIHFICSVLERDYASLQKQNHILQKMMNCMALEELQIYYLMLGRYYCEIYEGLLAKNYYQLSYDITTKLHLVDPLLLLSLAQYYTLSNDAFKAIDCTHEALHEFKRYYSMKYIIDCELLLCYQYIKQGLVTKAHPLLKQLANKLNHSDPYNQYLTLYHLYGHYYLALNDNQSAEKMYLEPTLNHQLSHNILLALIELYYQSSQSSKLTELLSYLVKQKHKSPQFYFIKYQYYYYLIHHPKSEFFRLFLIKEAIPFAKKQHDYEGFHLFSKTLIKYYQNLRKYKEALHISLQLY